MTRDEEVAMWKFVKKFGVVICVGIVVSILLLMVGMPCYTIFHSMMAGRAELAKQTFSKQVMVQEATAKMESAKLLAQAEVERAKGVAEANKIIGESLQHGGDQYLQYLAIDAQKELVNSPSHTVVYIPSGNNGIPLVKTVEQ